MVNFLVAGDLGAAANLIRNVMLLSDDVDWPLTTSRLGTILNQYPASLKTMLSNWIPIEEKLRFSERLYGVDISRELDWIKYKKNVIIKNKPAVFINHSFVFQLDNFFTFASYMPSIIVMPITDFGLAWQIRAYCEKKGVDIMHNFTFQDCVEEQKTQFINTYGQEAWNKENISNMRMIIKDRRDQVVSRVDSNMIIPLEWLIGNDDFLTVDRLKKHFNIGIDYDQATQVLNLWRSLHWPVEQTPDWKYA